MPDLEVTTVATTVSGHPNPAATLHFMVAENGEQQTGRGVVRVAVSSGRCWLCGLPAVAGEKLPGRRHKVRLLCKAHDQLVFGRSSEPPPPPH